MRYRTTSTPLGQVLLLGSDGYLTGLYVEHPKLPPPAADWVEDDGTLAAAERQLEEYFAGSRTDFELPVQLNGTAFQRAVWAELQRIPHGRTIGYGELARRIGAPRAARAVGAACGSNPVSIVVPCHRVVGADGSLTGYGWGVERKAWLLMHERRQVALSA